MIVPQHHRQRDDDSLRGRRDPVAHCARWREVRSHASIADPLRSGSPPAHPPSGRCSAAHARHRPARPPIASPPQTKRPMAADRRTGWKGDCAGRLPSTHRASTCASASPMPAATCCAKARARCATRPFSPAAAIVRMPAACATRRRCWIAGCARSRDSSEALSAIRKKGPPDGGPFVGDTRDTLNQRARSP